jgi:hypothetical protein
MGHGCGVRCHRRIFFLHKYFLPVIDRKEFLDKCYGCCRFTKNFQDLIEAEEQGFGQVAEEKPQEF